MRQACTWHGLAALAAALLLCRVSTVTAQTAPRQQDEQAIRRTAQDYLAALERGDAAKLKAIWTADGDFVDMHGRAYPAAELIEAAAQNAGQPRTREVQLTATVIRFLSNDVAIEDGASQISDPASGRAAPIKGRFMAMWVKQQGQWRLASLREQPAVQPTRESLADLDWLAGEWIAKVGDEVVEVDAKWNTNHTFLLREITVTRPGQPVFRGTQRIGWDPITERIHSWNFDAGGGYGEGTWTREGNGWTVQATGVLPDGQRTTATNNAERRGNDAFVWRSSAARAQGLPQPDVEMQFVRKNAAK